MSEPEFLQEIQIDPGVGEIEIKITARAKDEADVMRVLKSEHVKPESRYIYFYDTPDLKFFESGLVLPSLPSERSPLPSWSRPSRSTSRRGLGLWA